MSITAPHNTATDWSPGIASYKSLVRVHHCTTQHGHRLVPWNSKYKSLVRVHHCTKQHDHRLVPWNSKYKSLVRVHHCTTQHGHRLVPWNSKYKSLVRVHHCTTQHGHRLVPWNSKYKSLVRVHHCTTGRKGMVYFTKHSAHFVRYLVLNIWLKDHSDRERKEGNGLFNDTLNTFYLGLFGIGPFR